MNGISDVNVIYALIVFLQIWFCNKQVGENTLAQFMPKLSLSTGLSKKYGNHSLRVAGATILSRNSHGLKQIMSLTRHKSVSSLAI